MDRENFAASVGFIVGFVIACVMACTITHSIWQRDSVAKGYAEYSSRTGEWQWKVPATAEPKSGER